MVSNANRRIFLTAALGSLATLAAFLFARSLELCRERGVIEQSSRMVARGLEESLRAVTTRMEALASALSADPQSRVLADTPLLPGEILLAWAPTVSGSADGIFEFNADGARIPAGKRPDYHPIHAASPASRLATLRGLDVAALPGGIDTLLKARASRSFTVSEPAPYPPGIGANGSATLAILPLLAANGRDERGILVAIIEVAPFFKSRAEPWLQHAGAEVTFEESPSTQAQASGRPNTHASMVAWGNRQWRFVMTRTSTAGEFPSESWLILALGAIFTPLLAWFVGRSTTRGEIARQHNETQTVALAKEISGRLEAELALTEKQDDYQDLFEHVSDLILTFSGEGKILRVNPACARALGYSAEELTGTLIDRMLAPEDRPAFDSLLRDWSTADRESALELSLTSKSGARTVLLGELKSRRAGSKLISLRAVLRDVTELRRLSADLQRAQADLAALVDSTQDAIWSVDDEFKLRSFNAPFADLYVESPEGPAVIGADHLQLLEPQSRQHWRQLYERTLAGERITLERAEILGGQQRTFLISLSPIQNQKAISGVTVYRKDITEQKKLDTAIRALVEGSVNATGTAFYNLLAQHLAGALNVRYAFLGDFRPEHETIRILGFYPEGGVARVTEFAARESIAEVAAVKGSAHVAFGVRRMHPNDALMQDFHAEGAMAVALKAGNGALLGILGIFHDEPLNVTADTHAILRVFAARASAEIQRKNAEAALAQARDAAIASARLKTEFLTNMSHEIRTPINGIIGMTELLEGTQLPAESQRYLVNIRSCSELLLTLINDILDFSKIEAGKLQIERVDFDLPRMIADCIAIFSNSAQDKGIRLVPDIANGVPSLVVGDSVRIRQVLINLLSNAIKFTQSGVVRVAVEALDASETHARVRFSVKDSGIGISNEAQSRLFNPFVQADGSTTRRYGGSGLGLSICKRLVEMMDGEIGVISSEGNGAEFWFTLRLENSQKNNSMLTRAISTHVAPRPFRLDTEKEKRSNSRARVLVVEDNPINQEVAKALLKRMGCEAIIADNGREGFERLCGERFDIVFMDCQMPVMDGYEATAAIREHEKLAGSPRTIIVAMTAHALPTERAHCLNCGMDDYVAKPVSNDVLQKLLTRWVPGFAATAVAPVALPVEPAPPAEQPLDMRRLREAGGDREGIQRLAEMSIKQLTSRLDAVRKARDAGDAKEILRIAHMCVGSCGACGMNRLASLWRELELKAGDDSAVSLMISTIEIELAGVDKAIAEFLKSDPNL